MNNQKYLRKRFKNIATYLSNLNFLLQFNHKHSHRRKAYKCSLLIVTGTLLACVADCVLFGGCTCFCCVAALKGTGCFKSFPRTKLIYKLKRKQASSNLSTNNNDCGGACSFCIQGLAVPLVKRGSEKLHGTRVLGLAGGIRLELDCGGCCGQPELYPVGVLTEFYVKHASHAKSGLIEC